MIYRKKAFGNPTLRGRLLAQLAVYWLLYNFLLWHAAFLVDVFPNGSPAPLLQRYAEFAAQHMLWLGCMFIVAPLILWDMAKMTHGVAGPLVRLERTVKEMARGKHVSFLVLRKNDMLGQFAEALNELIEVHNRQVDARCAVSVKRNTQASADDAFAAMAAADQ
jgi:hypothetical protein